MNDDPMWDGTDAAHPAWWRGSDSATKSVTQILEKCVSGEDVGAGVIAYEPLEKLRRDILAMRDALKEIAMSPHSVYPEHYAGASQYAIGVVDGHRCAASTAREALNA